MKNSVFLLTQLLVFASVSFNHLPAQDYQTIKSDRIAYFADSTGDIKCIRIDSIFIHQGDSIYFPFSNIAQLNDECYTPYGPSWIGKKVTIRIDGYNLFFNHNGDTISLKTNALLHEKWTVYKLADTEVIIAEVVSVDTLSFLGQLDSVKTIEFKAYNKSMFPIVHPLNDMSVLLSKRFGLIRTLNFNSFPDADAGHGYAEPIRELHLVGLSKPKLGIQNLTWFEVFDFQPGDELHILGDSYGMGYHNTGKSILKYLERTDYEDAIVYSVEVTQSQYNTWMDSSSMRYLQWTGKSLIQKNPDFDKLPGEPLYNESGVFSYTMHSGVNLTKTMPSTYDFIFPSEDACWHKPNYEDCALQENYIKGLGGSYCKCENGYSYGGTEFSLVYYKKGQVTWGVPFVITEIPDVSSQPIVTIFPNPARDNIRINAPESVYPFIFELMSLNGQVLYHMNMVSPATSINVGKYGRGIFLYRLLYKNGYMTNGKLVIE